MPIRFTANKNTFLSLIMPALGATSTKSTLPALEGLLFTLKDNILTVCGYDLEKGVTSKATVFPKEEGSVIVNAKKIADIVKSFPDCDIKFEADDKNIVRIYGGDSDFVIHGFGADIFPSLPMLGGDNSFSINQSVFKEMINSTSFAVSQLDSRPILCGELIKIEGKKITIVALDNFRLAMREEYDAVLGNDKNFKLVVSGKTLNELCRLLSDDDELMRVEFTDKHIIFMIGDTVFFCRLLDGEYLDYERALPKDSKITVNVSSEKFLNSALRASLIVDEKLRTPLRCRFDGNTLTINCKTQYGSVNDNTDIIKTGGDIEIGFNHKYLLDALRACKGEDIVVSMSSPLMSMVLTPAVKSETGSFLYLVLPCRLKD